MASKRRVVWLVSWKDGRHSGQWFHSRAMARAMARPVFVGWPPGTILRAVVDLPPAKRRR